MRIAGLTALVASLFSAVFVAGTGASDGRQVWFRSPGHKIECVLIDGVYMGDRGYYVWCVTVRTPTRAVS